MVVLPDGEYAWTGTGEPVKQRISVIGEFCGLYTEEWFVAPPEISVRKDTGWDDLTPEEMEQVRQYVEFLRSRRSNG